MVDYRAGGELSVRGNPLPFNYWPARQNRRFGLNPMIYASDPWAVMHAATRRVSRTYRADAQAFLRQAQEYSRAAEQAGVPEAKPVLYYYSFLNAAKAFVLTKGGVGVLGQARHGLAEVYPPPGPVENGQVRLFANAQNRVNVFASFYEALTKKTFAATVVDVGSLFAQSLYGHRLWMQGDRDNRERFVQVEIQLRENRDQEWAWLDIKLEETKRRGRDLAVERILDQAELDAEWEAVTGPVVSNGTSWRVFQQSVPLDCGRRPLDAVPQLVKMVKPKLWRSIDPSAPFRRYYIYLSPPQEARLPQLLSVYALMFYFGSITRYRPSEFLKSLDGAYGAFIREFIVSQPAQFLFGLASEFAEQEISSVTGI